MQSYIKFKQEKDAKRTLFNQDRVKESWRSNDNKNQVIICEGEMDVLSLYEAGFPNCVSLPDGAPKQAKFDPNDKRFDYKNNPGSNLVLKVTKRISGKIRTIELGCYPIRVEYRY